MNKSFIYSTMTICALMLACGGSDVPANGPSEAGDATEEQAGGEGSASGGHDDATGEQAGGEDGAIDTVAFDTYTFVYRKYPDYSLKIAFDIPRKRASENTPFILWVTGGGWSKANINSFARHSEEFARKGIAGVRINYSVMDQGGNLQMGYDEVRAAYEFIRSKASEYSLDTLSFGFGAGSAGTTLASYHALKMKGCKVYIGCNGMYDLNTRYETSSFPGANCKYLKPYTEAQKRAMSPINNIGDHLPAVIMFHGDADVTINYRQSTAFEAALKAHGGTAVTHIYPGQVHAFFNYGKSEWDVDVTTRMMDFAIPRLLAPVSD